MKTCAVVILNWNGKAHLMRFLPSVVSSVEEDDSVIVADNGSTDDSVEWVKQNYPSVGIVQLDRNYGFAEGYNRAIARISGYRTLILLNSDVETPDGWTRPLKETLYSSDDIAAVAPKLLSYVNKDEFEYAGASGGYIDYFGYPFCRGRVVDSIEKDNGQYDDIREIFWASGAALCIRSEIFTRLGGFPSMYFAHMEEIDLCWRIQKAGYRVMVDPRSAVYHLGGGTLQKNSPAKVFYNHRNNLAMLLRLATPTQRIVVSVVRPILDMLAALSYLAGGHFRSFCMVFRAYRDFIVWHPELIRQRKAIHRELTSESKNIYCGSVLFDYMLKKLHLKK